MTAADLQEIAKLCVLPNVEVLLLLHPLGLQVRVRRPDRAAFASQIVSWEELERTRFPVALIGDVVRRLMT